LLINHRQFASASAQKAFEKGFQTKAEEINEIGWNAARDKFNMENPAPRHTPKDATPEGEAYLQGENEAILYYMETNLPRTESGN